MVCINHKCRYITHNNIAGNIKCNTKNRFNVKLPTTEDPQINFTKVVPTIGIIPNKLVITVAPQKDICPQGNTYPVKEIPIIKYQQAKPLQ